jgi:hypothetical protein
VVATGTPAQSVNALLPGPSPINFDGTLNTQLINTQVPLFDISGRPTAALTAGQGAVNPALAAAAAAVSQGFDAEAYRQALISQYDTGQYIAPVAGNPNTVINAQGIPTVQRSQVEAALLPLRSATATQLASAEYRALLEELLRDAGLGR